MELLQFYCNLNFNYFMTGLSYSWVRRFLLIKPSYCYFTVHQNIFVITFELSVFNWVLYRLYKRVSWLISELKSSTLLDKRDLALLLNHIIDGRFNIAKRALEFRTLKLRNGTFNKRLNEIKEHQKLLEHHIEV